MSSIKYYNISVIFLNIFSSPAFSLLLCWRADVIKITPKHTEAPLFPLPLCRLCSTCTFVCLSLFLLKPTLAISSVAVVVNVIFSYNFIKFLYFPCFGWVELSGFGSKPCS